MVRCPKCNRTYENDSQKFCTRDGGRLIPVEDGAAAAGYDPNSTIVGGSSYDPNATMVGTSTPTPSPGPSAPEPSFDPNATVISPVPPTPQPSSPSANTDPQMFQTIAGNAQNFPVATPTSGQPQQNSTADIPPPQQNPAASQSNIPMPARYDATAPTSSDLKQPGSSAVTSGNLGKASIPPPPTPQSNDNFGYTTGQSSPPAPPVNSNYPQGGGSAKTSASLQPPPGMAEMHTQALTPSNESYTASTNTGNLREASVSMLSSEPATAQPQTPPVATTNVPPQKKSSGKKMVFIGLGAMFIALFVIVTAAGVFVFTQHPEWIGMDNKPNTNESPNVNSSPNTNNTSPNTNESPNTNSSPNTNNGNGNENKDSTPPPPNSTQFVNASSGLSGDLASHFVPFSFYFHEDWSKSPSPKGYFVEVIRKLPDGFPQEHFAASYYDSKGTLEADRADFQAQAQKYSTELSKAIPGYQKISEGETTVNGVSGYEFRFTGQINDQTKGDVKFYGRSVFLPPGKDGEKNGVRLLMYGTSLAPELQSMEDFGTKGQLPVILNSFKLGQ